MSFGTIISLSASIIFAAPQFPTYELWECLDRNGQAALITNTPVESKTVSCLPLTRNTRVSKVPESAFTVPSPSEVRQLEQQLREIPLLDRASRGHATTARREP